MATSLARQLASLRTPGVETQLATSVYSGPFLFSEAETNHSSLASLRETVADSLSVLWGENKEFARYAVLLDSEAGDSEIEQIVTDCLHCLCPYLLLRPAQYVLQWLVTKHKVHVHHTSVLLFTLLPHNSYKIYQTTLQALDPTTVAQTAWLSQFMQTCVPTNQRTLHKAVASNSSFLGFLHKGLESLGEHLTRHPDTKVHRQTTLCMAAMLGGLQMCGQINEEKLHPILQIILTGCRSQNQELAGLASILLGWLLPRVTLKQKAVARVCKGVSRLSKESVTEDSMWLTLLLARTQVNADMNTVVDLVVRHEAVINSLVMEAEHSVEEDTVERLDNLVYSLAILAEALNPEDDEVKVVVSQEERKLLELLSASSSLVTLSEDTAERLAEAVLCLSNSLQGEDSTVKEFSQFLVSIKSNIQRLNPSTFQSCLANLGEADITFVPGVETPSSDEVEVAKLMASHPLLNFLSDKLLLKCTDKKMVMKIVKKNKDSLEKVLKSATEFLLSQLELSRLQILLMNLLKVTEYHPDLQKLVVEHLCTERICSKSILPVVELLLLPYLFNSDTTLTELIIKSELSSISPLLSLLSSLCPSSNMFTRALTQKLSLVLGPEHISTLIESPVLRASPSLVTLFLRLSSLLVSKSEKDWSVPLSTLITTTLNYLVLSGDSKQEDNVGLIQEARGEDAIAWSVIKDCIVVLAKNGSVKVMSVLIHILPLLYKKSKPDEALQVEKVLQESIDENYIQFLLDEAIKSSDLNFVYVCLHLVKTFTSTLTSVQLGDQAKNISSVIKIMFFLLSPKSKLQKIAFLIFPSLVEATPHSFLKQLADFFLTNKTEIINNLDNIYDILERSKISNTTCSLLLDHCHENPVEIFIRLSPFFDRLTSKKDAERMSKFGLDLLKSSNNGRNAEGLAVMVSKLNKLFLINLTSPLSTNFVSSCLSSNLAVSVSGLEYSLRKHFLHGLVKCPLLTQLPENQPANLLAILVNNAVLEEPGETRKVAVLSNPKPEAVMAELTNIWGADVFLSGKGRGKILQESGPEEVKKWNLTCWLLETLDNILKEQPDGWSIFIKPVFMLLRKVTGMEVEEGTYRLSLLLSLLYNLLNSISDVQLKQLDGSQLEPELLVSCIRTSPNPDTRNAALRVLARCAVSNPDFILHNSITIFTFMGSHLLQVDSRRSFQVAVEALNVLVPAIKEACVGRKGDLASNCMTILTTFVSASKDIPGHRLIEFLMRLIEGLGVQDYLWIASLLLAKKDKKGGERIVTELFCKLEPCQGIEALLRLMVNTRNDSPQLRKMFGVNIDRKEDLEIPDDWDMVRLRSLQLTSTILSSSSFKMHAGSLLQEDGDECMEMLNLLIEATILTIQQYGDMSVSAPVRIKKNLVAQSEKVLETALSLLPGNLFLKMASILLDSPASSVKLRALEVVSSKLCPPCSLPLSSLEPLLPPLVALAVKEEHPHTQQLALLAVRQLAKLVPEPGILEEAAVAFSCSFLDGISNPKVLGAAVLSCGDVLSALGPRAVTKVPVLVKWLLDKLESKDVHEDWVEKEITVVQNSLLYCLQKLVESFVGFLNPLLGRVICLSCSLAGKVTANTNARAKSLLFCLASSVSPHNTLNQASLLLKNVWTEATAVPPFVNFVAENCRRLERNQLASVSKEFVALFTAALGYRSSTSVTDLTVVDEVEQSIISAFLSVALRLSLEDFKPLYQRLVAQHQDGSVEQLTTMFNLTVRVGEKLKSLFSFGIESTVLLVTNTLATEKPPHMVASLLSSLTSLFTYNKLEVGSLTLPQYEKLVTVLLYDWLLPSPNLPDALSQLAASTTDDTAWKYFHYQLLMALRDPRSNVRIATLEVLEKCVTDRTDTYLPVLPDAVPFLQEILEDDDQIVETKCRDFIQHMETTFGQNIESYFV